MSDHVTPTEQREQSSTRESSRGSARWEGFGAAELASRLSLPKVAIHAEIGSTMDVAHHLAAEGTPAGTLVIAEQQTAGRGRAGHRWVSPAGTGIWMTLVERPTDVTAVELWGVRHGVHVARVLDQYAGRRVGIKWPNDLYIGDRKLAGILIEARWQEQQLLWVAIGIGVNIRPPAAVSTSIGLAVDTDRLLVLEAVVGAVRAAAELGSTLTPEERRECKARDIARGRLCREPAVGKVIGIGVRGDLRVLTAGGLRTFRSGSLVFDSDTEAA